MYKEKEVLEAIKKIMKEHKPCSSFRPPRGKKLGAPCVVCGFPGIRHKFKKEK